DEERPPALESPWLQAAAAESPWLAESAKSEADERPWRANTESTVSISKTDRHTLGKYAEVDVDIVRGISLRGSLSGGGRIWRYSPDTWTPSDRMSLYEMSKKVSRFQVFLSHTWWTPGRWKVLSLSLQCGWHYVLLCWCLSIALCTGLCIADVLPMPLKYKASIMGFTDLCPMGFWNVLVSCFATVAGVISVPLWPARCARSDISFVDVTSIHQEDQELKERGVYGIAGFLCISDELRILWSSPYLSRLWCVFELAAYKKVNPGGTITFRPLFIERTVCVMLASAYVFAALFLVARDVFGPGITTMAVAFAIFACPYAAGIYLLRMSFREKHQLISQLANFDLEDVHCAEQFDRDFIHAAIEKWYGSKRAFTEFVRQDLRKDVEKILAAKRLPRRYLLLLLLPILSCSMEFFLANWKGGAPRDVLLSFAIGILFGYDIFYVTACSLLMVYLCDILAPKRCGCLDHLQTLFAIFLVVGLLSLGNQLSAQAYQGSLSGAVVFLVVSIGFAWLMWWMERDSIDVLAPKDDPPSPPARAEVAGSKAHAFGPPVREWV
ncbi:unnamed protein product, partial [Symbiodinium sp. CCMP2456]